VMPVVEQLDGVIFSKAGPRKLGSVDRIVLGQCVQEIVPEQSSRAMQENDRPAFAAHKHARIDFLVPKTQRSFTVRYGTHLQLSPFRRSPVQRSSRPAYPGSVPATNDFP